MRTLFIKDVDIPTRPFKNTVKELRQLYKDNAGIDIEHEMVEWSIPNLPFEVYYSDFRGISRKYLDIVARLVEAHHGKKFDQITIVVADHNWKPSEDGIWGWNISAGIRGYEVQQCRFETVREDMDGQVANSLGVMYHEMMHSHDGFCYRILGGKVETMVGVTDWDNDVVHGQHPDWQYIRHNENTGALRDIKYLLQASIEERKRQFNDGTPISQRMAEGYRTAVLRATKPFAKHYFINHVKGTCTESR